ncbi:phage major tail tube protein [Roseibium sp.]|uniref:phage major tail tube protein n=1 Tax=Roseibium sp. TaxID=1936156 RepID=UPI003B525D1A
MANPAYQLTIMDVRRATRAGTSRPLKISKIILPAVKFLTVNRNPGGGVGSIDHGMPRLEPLEPGWETFGPDDDVFTGMGEMDKWTFGCAYKRKNGAPVPARIEIEGVITEWAPDEGSASEFQKMSHKFQTVTHYEFILNGKELFYFDEEEIEIRRDGVSLTQPHKTAAGISFGG